MKQMPDRELTEWFESTVSALELTGVNVLHKRIRRRTERLELGSSPWSPASAL
jgi:hypothetical protein